MACQSPTSTQKENLGRVRADPSRFQRIARSPLLIVLRWYRSSLLRLLLLECIAIPRRMEWIYEIHAAERLGGKDSIRNWIGQSRVPAVYKSAYISHMQQMEGHHPFLSIFDLFLLSQTWKAGLEYGIHIGTSQSPDKLPPSNPPLALRWAHEVYP